MGHMFFRKGLCVCVVLVLVLLCPAAGGFAEDAWVCPLCGRENTTNFCTQCGTAKPEWICRCGTYNTGLYCGSCGASHAQLDASYRDAVWLFQKGRTEDATEIFVTLGAYEDTALYLTQCFYEIGKKRYEEDKPEEAAMYFRMAEDYLDAKEWIRKCAYRQAEIRLEEGNREEAIRLFREAEGYSDAADRIREIYYQQGLDAREAGDWNSAVDFFSRIGGYMDAEAQIRVTRYMEGEAKLGAGDYAGALKAFDAAGSYADAKARIRAVYYAKGEAQLRANDVAGAIVSFGLAGNYSDAETMLRAAWYALGKEKAEEDDPAGAIEAFRFAGEYGDATEQILSIKAGFVALGDEKLIRREWESAIEAYETAGNYPGAEEGIRKAKYAWAEQLAKAGREKDALELYEQIPDYLDSASIAEQLRETVEAYSVSVVPQEDIGSDITWTVYSGKKKVKAYERPAKEQIRMPEGNDYTKVKIGVLTFRKDAFRRNAAVGTVKNADRLRVLWQTETGSLQGASKTYSGTGRNSQPAIARWSVQVREKSNMADSKREKKALTEVIAAGMDGVIRFLDLEDGTATRDSIRLGYPMMSAPSLHPAGFPYMNVGQYARKMKNKTGKIGLRQYNLYHQKEMSLIDGLDSQMRRPLNNMGSFNTSALIDRTSDTVVAIGTSGMLYLISLNSEFDYDAGTYKSDPSVITMVSRVKGEKNAAMTAVESSPAMYDRYIFYADMGGFLRCVDSDTLSPMWIADTGDSVLAAVALDQRTPGELDLYTANMLNNRQSGDAQIRRYDAETGREIWCTEIGVERDRKDGEESGCAASPVIGENGLGDLVYFTVTRLSSDGCARLGIPEGTPAALVALRKETGDVVWVYPLGSLSVSSPVAVYDDSGRGWIIQCAQDGTITALDGMTGQETAKLTVEGEIEGSPAVYDSIMVIGTTGKGTTRIYGIRVGAE